jgi:tRNA threonylcarbamoyladenosine biosynthesis protein TsaB
MECALEPRLEPRLLILETSGRIGQLALAQGETVMSSRRLDQARRHARDLVPAIAELLAAQHWSVKEIDGVIVSRGPGSYTGLRVGIISAKAFAYATGCRLLAIDTFAAIALQAPPEATRLNVLADAQQGKVYVQSFVRQIADNGTTNWTADSSLRIERLEDWLARRPKDTWVTGPGIHNYEARLQGIDLLVGPENRDPQPQSLLRIGLSRIQASERDDLWNLEPLYLRPSSAEEKWQAERP